MLIKEEWPLMLFTMLSQFAIGTFSLLIVVSSFITTDSMDVVSTVVRPGIYASVLVMALALVCSFFHLGTPYVAYMSIANAKSSWLSREIITGGAFLAFAAAYAYTCYSGSSTILLGWLAVIIGLTNIYCMANIYRATIFPAWTSVNTFISFYCTTFALGTLSVAVSIALSTQGAPPPEVAAAILRRLLYLTGLSLFIPLLYLPVFLRNLYSGNAASIASARLLGNYSLPLVIRWMLSFAGFGLLLSAVLHQAVSAQALSTGLIYAAAGLILAGEFLDRYIFYAVAVPIGIAEMIGCDPER